MRKQDRIANQQQRPPQQPKPEPGPEPRGREEIKGGSQSSPPHPQRQPGKLPLPD
jgi:hypothetical protein